MPKDESIDRLITALEGADSLWKESAARLRPGRALLPERLLRLLHRPLRHRPAGGTRGAPGRRRSFPLRRGLPSGRGRRGPSSGPRGPFPETRGRASSIPSEPRRPRTPGSARRAPRRAPPSSCPRADAPCTRARPTTCRTYGLALREDGRNPRPRVRAELRAAPPAERVLETAIDAARLAAVDQALVEVASRAGLPAGAETTIAHAVDRLGVSCRSRSRAPSSSRRPHPGPAGPRPPRRAPWITAPSSTTSAGAWISAKRRAARVDLDALFRVDDCRAPCPRPRGARRGSRPRRAPPSPITSSASEMIVPLKAPSIRKTSSNVSVPSSRAPRSRKPFSVPPALLRAHASPLPDELLEEADELLLRVERDAHLAAALLPPDLDLRPERTRARRSSASRVSASDGARLLLLRAAPPRSPRRAPRPRARRGRAGRSPSRASPGRRPTESARSARACPAVSAPDSSASRTAAGSFRRRSAFATVARSLPTRSATSSCVSEKSSRRCRYASASSSGRQVAPLHVLDEREEEVVAVRRRPRARGRAPPRGPRAARRARAARRRGSGSARPSRVTRTGWRIPVFAIERESSSIPSSSKRRRGWRRFASRSASGTVRSAGGLAAALRASGMSADRPRPSARLLGHRRNRSSREPRRRVSGSSRRSSSRAMREIGLGARASARRRAGSACRRTAPPPGARCAGTGVRNTRSPKCFRISSRTCRERFVRSSHIVATTPARSRRGFRLSFTRSIVARSSDTPSSAKYSHWIGRRTPVRRRERVHASGSPATAGSRSRTNSNRSFTPARRSLSRNSRRSASTSSTSAPTRSRFAGSERQARQLRRAGDLLERGLPEQPVVRRCRERGLVDAEAARRIALRIEVHEEHGPLERGERGGEADGGRRLADAPLLVRDGEDRRRCFT